MKWRFTQVALVAPILGGFCMTVGCSQSATPESIARAQARSSSAAPSAAAQLEGESNSAGSSSQSTATSGEAKASLAELLLSEEDLELLRQRTESDAKREDRLPSIDEEQVAAAGIRKIEGKHLTLYTDVPADFQVNDIPTVFDKAVPLWCKYFDIPEESVADWKLVGYLIQSKEKHEQAGLFPPNLPGFLHGYQRGRELWVYEQPSDYYRRHLVLHEGVHGFMNFALGGSGPPWYREGMAELLATHLWRRGKLEVEYFPKSREEVPYWGRIKLIKDEIAVGRGQLLMDVFRQNQKDHLRLVPYAWSWAATAFLNGHPKYRVGFRDLKDRVSETSILFTKDFEARYRNRMIEMEEEWQIFIVNLEYGYDFARNTVQYASGVPLPEGGRSAIVASDRGWQSTGIRLDQGQTYQIVSKGRFKVRRSPVPWWSEPGGITIEYWNGYPLGMLQGAIRNENTQMAETTMTRPFPVGINRRVSPPETGTLYLRINDSPSQLNDNEGQVTVKVMEYDAVKQALNKKMATELDSERE